MTLQARIAQMKERLSEIGEVPGESPEDIQAACCAVFGITEQELKSRKRFNYMAHPRMISMSLMRSRLKYLSLSDIGRLHGGKDQGTIQNAVKKVADYCETDRNFKRNFDLIIKLLEPPKTA